MIIVKNPDPTNSIFLEDFGLTILNSNTVELSEFFDNNTITESAELKTHVQNSTLVINDGISDLNVTDALDHLSLMTKYEDKIGTNHILFFNSFSQFPISGEGELLYVDKEKSIVYKWNTITLRYNKISNEDSGDTPNSDPEAGDMWIPNTMEHEPYIWDNAISSYVSLYRNTLTYCQDQDVDGSYLSTSNSLNMIYHHIPREAVMYNIYITATDGNTSKQFSIYSDSNLIYTCNFAGTLKIDERRLNILINPNTSLQVFVEYSGASVKNVVCQIEIAWRYIL